MNLTEATMKALRGELNEVKGSDKLWTCIEDRQYGDFAVGETMTAEEWGETAYGWAYSDDWTDPEEPLLKNFNTEQECINFIQDMWEITIVPSDSPEAKEFLGEARSHKEDSEKVAPRVKSHYDDGVNYTSNKLSRGGDEEISVAIVGPNKGNVTTRDIKRDRVRSAKQARERNKQNWKDFNDFGEGGKRNKYNLEDTASAFGGEYDMQNYETYPNQKSREYMRKHNLEPIQLTSPIFKELNSMGENKKVIEVKRKKQEARSHKEDNEKVAPRTDNNNVFQTRRRYGELDDIPKRARFSANKDNNSNWGYFDNDEVKTYTQSTDDIEKYKGLKADAEYERGEAERHSTWAQRKDDLAREIVNKRKLNATTEAKKIENKDGAGALDTQAYWAYVLGYDLMHDKLKQEGPECDTTFEKAWKIADDFMKSEEFKNTDKSGYDALVDYLKNNNLV